MKTVYVRAVRTLNKTTGAFNSSEFMLKKFSAVGVCPVSVNILPIRQWVSKFLTGSLNLREHLSLIAADFNDSFYSRIVRFINYRLFKWWINYYSPDTAIILDGLFPISKLPKGREYISFIRSSPHCFSFSKLDGRLDHFLHQQLIRSSAIVCASNDAFDSWKSFGGLSEKEVFNVPVPLTKILDGGDENKTDLVGLDIFLGKGDAVLKIIVSGGNLGPRKGLIPLLDQLARLDSKKFEVHLFGSYNQQLTDTCQKYAFSVIFHGYQKLDFLSQSSFNVVRVYPALSECMSRIQLEGIFSGDPCIIYRRGMEPILNDWIGSNKIADCFSDISAYIEEANYDFRLKNEVSSAITGYKFKFDSEFTRLFNYVCNI
jgi:hypothetical protein